jgi:hypothetical protein
MGELLVHFRHAIMVFSPNFAYSRRVRVVGGQLDGRRIMSAVWIGLTNTASAILALVGPK